MTSQEKEKLIQAALAIRKNAYAPYSKFMVGAALLTASGQVFTGCNVENQSYGLTICAERNAISKAISEGEQDFKAMAIVAGTKEPVLPCGACRQVMAEFNPGLKLILANVQGETKEFILSDLFPHTFQME